MILKIEPYKQKKAGFCGPAVLKIVFSFYGINKTEEELGKICGTSAEKGTNISGLKKAADFFGFKFFIKDLADFKDIQYFIKRKTPVIVDWFSVDEGHYSVAIGFDNKNIYLADPEFSETRKIDKKYLKEFGLISPETI